MPVEFLTREQEACYGKYSEDPTPEQLTKYFWFDDQDRAVISQMRSEHNQLGFAIQLGTVRFLGAFLTHPASVPEIVSLYVAQQLDLDEKILSLYSNERTIRNHAQEIKQRYGYHDFTEQPYHWKLVRWLYTRAWLTAERPSVLFDLATAKCVSQKILLPGVTVMERLIAQVRGRAAKRFWRKLAKLPSLNQKVKLEHLLKVEPQNRKTKLDLLRNPPTKITANGLIKAMERLEELRLLGASGWDISKIPIGRIRILSRYASMARAQAVSRMNDERRMATLISFAIVYTISAQDDVLELMERIFTEMFNKSARKEQKTRVRTIKDLDKAARKLGEVCSLLLDQDMVDHDLRRTIFSKLKMEDVKTAIQTVNQLTKPPDQKVAFEELFRHYKTIRKFLPRLMTVLNFQATSAGKPALDAWNFLADSESKQGKNKYHGAPLHGITSSWEKIVLKNSDHKVNPCAYTFWVIERLLTYLKHHDIYIPTSDRYGDPRTKLIQDETWEAVKPHVLRTLEWPSNANEALHTLSEELEQSYKQTVERWTGNSSVRIETFAGKERLVLSPLDRLEEPESVKQLRKRLRSVIPHTDLPELILEVNRWTHFTDAFTHISEGGSRVKDLSISICAVLLSQACNIGLDPVVQPGIPALERDRLTWVEQNYFRAETLTQANARLVDFHSQLKLSNIWGGGEVASADGLRFVTPMKSIHSGSNPKYFGTGRGVTYYNFTSDQFTGFHGIVIPGTIRDSLYLLAGILEQQTTLQPKEVMTDTAGYSDIIFGLFGLLGYQFSPRIADIGGSRFWKINSDADYGELNKLAKNKIRKDIISRYWDDMLRVAGSLKLGTVHPTQLIQMMQRGGKPTMLGRAIGEFGRIYKTQHLLTYLDDEGYRRKILTQLNRGESRHSLARAIFYGKKGELYQRYQEGQEDQLGALGLVVNAIILWNTQYLEASLDVLKQAGYHIDIADIQRLSPLGYNHINIMGRYSFNVSDDIEQGRLRPLLPLNEIFSY